MTPSVRRLLLAWAVLMVLLVIEFGASFLPLGRSARPLVLIPAALMVAGVGTLFMQVAAAPRSFASSPLLQCSGSPSCSASAAWTR